MSGLTGEGEDGDTVKPQPVLLSARFMHSMVTLEALWKVQGETTSLEVFVEALKMQSSQFPSGTEE